MKENHYLHFCKGNCILIYLSLYLFKWLKCPVFNLSSLSLLFSDNEHTFLNYIFEKFITDSILRKLVINNQFDFCSKD